MGGVHAALRDGSVQFISNNIDLLLAACINAGVTTLYSEDLSDGVTYESVTVINPFK